MSLLILEERSCQVITACARMFHPDWSFERFEAIQCNATDPDPADGNRYDASYIFHIAGPSLDMLDREVPFLFPLERGTHYLWELFNNLPRSGGSRSSRQFWNCLSRAMSWIALPITEDELVEHFTNASLQLLANSVDMGDRFYIPEMDYGGWNGGIVTKDFLIEGLKMLAAKLEGPARESKRRRKAEEEAEAAVAAEAEALAEAEEAKEEAAEDSEAESAEKPEEKSEEASDEAGVTDASVEREAIETAEEETAEEAEAETIADTAKDSDMTPGSGDGDEEEKVGLETSKVGTFTEGGNEDESLSGHMD
ncbi:MAG: hypothetical protein J5645_05165 [Lachnospiraceae bacterium]|nr:hypothetical protein [Lachnospiraceae bacterium]